MSRNLVTSQSFMPPNLLINGGFDFWQRATSASFGNTASYGAADRWMSESAGSGSVAVSRVSSVPDSRFPYSMQYVHSTANIARHWQKIEADNIAPYIGKTVCLSAWIRFVSGTFHASSNLILSAVTPAVGDAKDVWQSDFANAVSVDAKEFTGDSLLPVVGGPWVRVYFKFIVPPAAVNGLAIQFRTQGLNTNATVQIAGAMLTEGAIPPADFYRAGINIQQELAMCQRYYEKSWSVNVALGTAVTTGMTNAVALETGTTAVISSVVFATEKRTDNPSCVPYSPNTGAISNFRNQTAAADVPAVATGPSSKGILFRANGTSITAGNYIRVHWTADAEL